MRPSHSAQLNYGVNLSWVLQHPFAFLDQRNRLFVFQTFGLPIHHMLDRDFVVAIYFGLFECDGIYRCLSLLGLPCGTCLCWTLVEVRNCFFLLAVLGLLTDLLGFLNALLLLLLQFAFKQKGNHIFIDIFNHRLEEFEGFKFINQ